MTSTTEKIIKIRTSLENYDKAIKQLKDLDKATSSIAMPDVYNRDLERVVVILSNMDKMMQKIAKNELFSDQEIYDLEQGLNQVGAEMDHLLDVFYKYKAPKEDPLTKSLNTDIEKIKELKKELNKAQLAKRKYVIDGRITTHGKDYLFDQAARQTDGGIKIGSKTYKTGVGLRRAYDKASKDHQKEIDEVLDKLAKKYRQSDESLTELIKAQKKLENAYIDAKNRYDAAKAPAGKSDSQFNRDYKNVFDSVTQASLDYKEALEAFHQEEELANKTSNVYTYDLNKKNKTLMGTVAKTYTMATALRFLKQTMRTAVQTVVNMDEALTNMSVVTTMTREQTWGLVDDLQNLAKSTGKTTTEIANMATKFYQQGKSTKEVLKLTEAAAKAATIAGITGSESIDLLTNAMNGFALSADRAMEVSDKFAALAAASATDYEELATALSKVAAQANLAGMSMDFTLGMLAKGIEVTREAPETIGTALKTVISRMRELTDYGKTLEDGMDVNRVAAALSNVGIEMMDVNGQFRDMEEVLVEVGKQWEYLNKNQQANIAVALAGTRQQSRLIAMMQNFDRTMELVDVSATSYGATLAQQAKYMDGMGAKITLLKNSFEELLLEYANSDIVIDGLETITSLLDFLNDNLWIVHGTVGILLAQGARRIVQTQILKQHTFEVEKEQRKIAIEQEKLELQRLQTSRISVDAALYKTEAEAAAAAKSLEYAANEKLRAIQDQKYAEEELYNINKKAELERQSIEQNAALEKQKMLEIALLDAQLDEGNAEEGSSAFYEAQLRAQDYEKELNALVTETNTKLKQSQDRLAIIENNHTETVKKLTEAEIEAQKELTQATKANLDASAKLESKQKELYAQAEKQRALDIESSKLKLRNLEYEARNATLTLRNIIAIIKKAIALSAEHKAQAKVNKDKKEEVEIQKEATVVDKAETESTEEVTKAKLAEAAARDLNAKAMDKENMAQTRSMALDVADRALPSGNSSGGLLSGNVPKASWLKKVGKVLGKNKAAIGKAGLIGLAIAGAALSITGIVKMYKTAANYEERMNNLVAITGEELNKLQVELYNVNKRYTDVRKLGDEFEELNNKIVLSADEAERLQQIIDSVNDTAGFNVIDAETNSEKLKQIRAYETSQQIAAESITSDMKSKWDNAYADTYEASQNTGSSIGWGVGAGLGGAAVAGIATGLAVSGPVGWIVGGILALGVLVVGIVTAATTDLTNAAEEARKTFIADMQKSEAGKQALYAIGRQEIDGLSEMSDKGANAILEAFRWSMDDLWKDNVDTMDEFIAEFKNAGFDQAFLEDFDTILNNTDSIYNSWNFWHKLSSEQKSLLHGIVPELEIIGTLSSTSAARFEELNASSKDIESWWNSISEYMTKAGKSKDEITSTLKTAIDAAMTDPNANIQSREDLNTYVGKQLMKAITGLKFTESEVFVNFGGTQESAEAEYEQLRAELVALNDELQDLDENSDAYQNKQKEIINKAQEYNAVGDQLNFWTNKQNELYKAQIGLLEQCFPIQTVQEFTDALAKVESRWERIAKATDISSLSAADYLSLIQDYPEILDDLRNKRLGADVIAKYIQQDINNVYATVERDKADLRDKYNAAIKQGLVKNVGLFDSNGNFNMPENWTDMTITERFKELFGDNANILDDEQNRYYNLVAGIIDDYIMVTGKSDYLEEIYGKNGENYIAVVTKETVDELTDYWASAERALHKYKALQDLYAKDTKEYAAAEEAYLDKLQENATRANQEIQAKKDELTAAFGQDVSAYLSIDENGLNIHSDAINALQTTDKALYDNIMAWIYTHAKTFDEEIEQLYSKNEEAIMTMNDTYIAALEDQAEKENEILEKRKEAYETYFDNIDALEEEQERTQTKEDIIKQLSALSTGVDGASKSKIKELQSQLNDLLDEEAKAAREAVRDQVLKDIDDEIEANNDQLKTNTDAIKAVTAAILYGDQYKNSDGTYNWAAIMSAYNKDIPVNANGGLVDYTGLAWVDGSKTKPEAFLSPTDTLNIQTFTEILNDFMTSSIGDYLMHLPEISNNNSASDSRSVSTHESIVIENINIKTEHLNNTQDFKTAGSTLAQEFAAVIRERGLNVNVRK